MKQTVNAWTKRGIALLLCGALSLWGSQTAGAATLGEYSFDRSLPDGKVMLDSPRDVAKEPSGNYAVLLDDLNGKYAIARHDAQGNYIQSVPLPDGYLADSVTADVYGNLFVTADAGGDGVVIKLDPDGGFTTFGSTDLDDPRGVAADESGNVYVASYGDDSIVKFAPDGTMEAKWTSYNGIDFENPEDVTVAANGDLYAVDTNAIVRLQPDGTYLDHLNTLIYVGGQYFNHPPYALTTDELGNVYVAIQGMTIAPDIVGFNVLKYSLLDDSREGVVRYGSGHGEASWPAGMIYDNGKLILADYNWARVKVFDLTGQQLDEWYQAGLGGAGQLAYAGSVQVDANGDIYARDRGNERVLIIPGAYPNSGSIETLSIQNGGPTSSDVELELDGNGNLYLFERDYSGGVTNSIVWKLRQVSGSAWEVTGQRLLANARIDGFDVDANGSAYLLVDNERVYRVTFTPDTDQDGMEETEEELIADLDSYDWNGASYQGWFTGPAVAPNGDLYLADGQNQKMLQLRQQGPSYAIVDVWDDLSFGSSDHYPVLIKIDGDGYVYLVADTVTDGEERLHKYTADGRMVDELDFPDWLTSPAGLEIDSRHDVYVTESNLSRILKFDFRSGRLKQLTARAGASDLALSPAFDSDVSSYTLNVGNDVDALTVTAAAFDPDANVQVSGNGGSGASPYTASLQVGTNALTVTVTAGGGVSKTYSLTVHRAQATSGSGGGGGGGGASPTANGAALPAEETESPGETTIVQAAAQEDGQYVAEWKVDAGGGASENQTIEIQSELGNWELPVDALQPPAEDVTLRVTIRLADDAVVEQLQEQAAEWGVSVVGAPIVFTTEWVDPDGNAEEFDTFAQYVTRSVTIAPGNAPVDPDQLVVLLYDPVTGSFTPVPTQVRIEDGKTVVSFKRKGNSVYVVVQHGKTFDDLAHHWAKGVIETLAAKYIVTGKTDTVFDPSAKLTRAEFAAMLTRALGLEPAYSRPPAFSDVAPSDWYAPYVSAAVDAGLIRGYEDGTFASGRNISRQEAAEVMRRAMRFAGYEPAQAGADVLRQFADHNAISAWAKEAVAELIAEGNLRGRPDGRFAPQDDIARAEAAQLLYGVLRTIGFID